MQELSDAALEERRRYYREYRRKHREQMNAHRRAHPEKVRQWQDSYWERVAQRRKAAENQGKETENIDKEGAQP